MSHPYVCQHRHPKRREPLPTEELAERTLRGLAYCWTLLNRIEAEWEGRAAVPVREWDIFAAISRVREEERRLAAQSAAMRRYRAKRRAKARVE